MEKENKKIFVVCSVDDEYGGVNEVITATTDKEKAKTLAERMNCVIETVEDGTLDGILTGGRFYIVEFHVRTREAENVRRLPLDAVNKPDSVESLCEKRVRSNIVTVIANSFGEAEEKARELYTEYCSEMKKRGEVK